MVVIYEDETVVVDLWCDMRLIRRTRVVVVTAGGGRRWSIRERRRRWCGKGEKKEGKMVGRKKRKKHVREGEGRKWEWTKLPLMKLIKNATYGWYKSGMPH